VRLTRSTAGTAGAEHLAAIITQYRCHKANPSGTACRLYEIAKRCVSKSREVMFGTKTFTFLEMSLL